MTKKRKPTIDDLRKQIVADTAATRRLLKQAAQQGEAERKAEAAARKAEREAEVAQRKAEREAEAAKRKEEAAARKAEREAEAAKRKEEAAKHKANLKAEVAKHKADLKAEFAKRKAEREEEAAKRKADLEAEFAARKAEREEEAAKREAELKAEFAKRKAEREAEREADKIERKKIDKQIAENNKLIGGLGNILGREFEKTVIDALWDQREVCGIAVDDIHPNMESVAHGCQFDIVATNGDHLIVFEAKHTLTVKGVREFVGRRLPLFGAAYPQMVRGKKVHGAVAYQRTGASGKAVAAALRAGLYVLCAVSDKKLLRIRTINDITERRSKADKAASAKQ